MNPNSQWRLVVQFFDPTPVCGVPFYPEVIKAQKYEFSRLVTVSAVFHFQWHRVYSNGSTRIVGTPDKAYTPTTDDIGKKLNLSYHVICNGSRISGSQTSSFVIPFPSLIDRSIIVKDSSMSSQPIIKVLSYNILRDEMAMLNASDGKLTDHPRWVQHWEFRKLNIVREIVRSDADVLCLQEVQNDSYENYLRDELQKIGYDAIYMRRKNPNLRAIGNGQLQNDGVAICFRTAKFDVMPSHTREIHFCDKLFPLLTSSSGNYDYAAHARLAKNNIALAITLSAKDGRGATIPGCTFTVCNTHICANLADVKLFQVSTLLTELERKCFFPLILCGDFNSIPTSQPLRLITTRQTRENEWMPPDPAKIFPSINLHHTMHLTSAYSGSDGNTFSKNFHAMLDYIFYDYRFRLKGLLELPNISMDDHMPSPASSSDHVPIMGVFELLPTPEYMKTFKSSC
ncbi:poly(A)-specific ribonuclease [Ranunculus cassubicifolius]